MNRTDLQKLARTRLREAEAVLNAGEWSGSYYLAGYAVECGLKACIAKRTNLHDSPNKDRVLRSYSHKVDALMGEVDLKATFAAALNTDALMEQNWLLVKDWDEQSRYQLWLESDARRLVDAVSNSAHGILSWIMNHW